MGGNRITWSFHKLSLAFSDDEGESWTMPVVVARNRGESAPGIISLYFRVCTRRIMDYNRPGLYQNSLE